MIWLSSSADGNTSSTIYFDIRDIRLQSTTNGLLVDVCGALGDGTREIGCEVSLGASDRVQLLPVWHDHGVVDNLGDDVDTALLGQELLAAIRIFLADKGLLPTVEQPPSLAHNQFCGQKSTVPLAA